MQIASYGLGDDPLTAALTNVLAPTTSALTTQATNTAIADLEAKLVPIVTGVLVVAGIILGAELLKRKKTTTPATPGVSGKRRRR